MAIYGDDTPIDPTARKQGWTVTFQEVLKGDKLDEIDNEMKRGRLTNQTGGLIDPDRCIPISRDECRFLIPNILRPQDTITQIDIPHTIQQVSNFTNQYLLIMGYKLAEREFLPRINSLEAENHNLKSKLNEIEDIYSGTLSFPKRYFEDEDIEE